jgi:hypothetical protein
MYESSDVGSTYFQRTQNGKLGAYIYAPDWIETPQSQISWGPRPQYFRPLDLFDRHRAVFWTTTLPTLRSSSVPMFLCVYVSNVLRFMYWDGGSRISLLHLLLLFFLITHIHAPLSYFTTSLMNSFYNFKKYSWTFIIFFIILKFRILFLTSLWYICHILS